MVTLASPSWTTTTTSSSGLCTTPTAAATATAPCCIKSTPQRVWWTHFTYDSERHVTSVYPGQSHHGVQGNWVGQYGDDGYLLCAFNDDSSDLSNLPGPRGQRVPGQFHQHPPEHRTPTSPTLGRSPAFPDRPQRPGPQPCGSWQDSSAFTLTVPSLNTAQSFNLSVYTNSLGHAG